jgi:hypothetical protein
MPTDTSVANAENRLAPGVPRFCLAMPSHINALGISNGRWKYGFDNMEPAAIREFVRRDIRPQWSAEVFPGFRQFDIIELGPQDGFVTAGLEAFGVGSITSIEASVDSFLRCLILKNTLGLRATFLLGDFLRFLHRPAVSASLIYASGVLYHLVDPVGFLLRCGEISKHIYLWTFHYVEEAIRAHAYESRCFTDQSEHQVWGQNFTYFRRWYTPEIRESATYAGGLGDSANWMTLADIERALALAGFRIKRRAKDSFNGIPAMNLWASQE